MNGNPPVVVSEGTEAAFREMSPSRLPLLTIALLVAATVAAFLPALGASFVLWDDDINITTNQHIRALSVENLRWMFADTGQAMRYKPLSWLSWATLYAFVKDAPWSYHLANLMLHCACTVLVFLLIQKLFERKFISALDGGGGWQLFCSAIGALLWGVHPLRAEPVVWATGLPYCQSSFFVLLSLMCYLNAHGPRRRVFLSASLISFFLALFTYPLVLTYPAVLFVLDFVLLNRLNPNAWYSREAVRGWLGKLPFVALGVLFVAIALYSRFAAYSAYDAPAPVTEFGVLSRLMQAFYVWAYYFWKPFVPLDLSPVYTTLVSFRPSDSIFIGSAVLVVLTTLILFRMRARWGGLLALWLCHLALLVPFLGLTEHPHFPNDRYSYLASICWSIVIAALLGKLGARTTRRGLIAGVTLTLVVIMGAMTFEQTRIWRNSVSLFEHMLEKLGDDPFRYSIYPRLARSYLVQGENAKAARFYLLDLEQDPNNAESHEAVGTLLFGFGKKEDATSHLMEAVRLSPGRVSARVNLGSLFQAEGKTRQAREQYQEALRVDPGNVRARHLLGVAFVMENKLDEAIQQFTETLRIDPGNQAVRHNLALAQSQKARIEGARRGPR